MKKKGQCVNHVLKENNRVKFPKGPATKATDILNMVHSDICGPLNLPTHIWNQYFITFVDGKSRYTNPSEAHSKVSGMRIFALRSRRFNCSCR
jgi:hypothetical protein